MINKLKTLFLRIKLIKKIDKLEIKESGIDFEDDPFIILGNNTIFYGSKVNSRLNLILYHVLSFNTKRYLKKECVQVAIDIIIRYIEQGLKYGGPKKQSRYKVKEGDFVAEMGGFQGFCSIKLAQNVGPEGKVVVIEPMKDNFRLLKKNKLSNNLEQMIIINKGVWDSNKMLTFSMRKGDHQSSSLKLHFDNDIQYEVEANALDKLFESVGIYPKDFIIIQLNGVEINALKGLTSFKPKNLSIAARYDIYGEDSAKSIKYLLESRGYNVEIQDDDFVFGKLLN